MTENKQPAPLTLARGEYITATPDKAFTLAAYPPRTTGVSAYRWTVWQNSTPSNSKGGYCASKRDAVSDANSALASLIADTARGIA